MVFQERGFFAPTFEDVKLYRFTGIYNTDLKVGVPLPSGPEHG
jgi:hypothetical protein